MNHKTRKELTLGQRRLMERMQEAQNDGLSLTDYYRAHGLSMAMLYKGAAPTGADRDRARTQLGSGADNFVQVRVQESAAGAELSARCPVCRLRHPNGWLNECGIWPHSQWLLQLIG